jgi:hypothetical protein
MRTSTADWNGKREVRASLGRPWGRTLAAFCLILTPAWLLLVLLVGPRAGISLVGDAMTVVATVALTAVLAWLNVSSTFTVAVTVSDNGIVMERRTVRPGKRYRQAIPWSRLESRVVYSSYVGGVGLIASDPPNVINLTMGQARVVLGHPSCPKLDLPPKLAARLSLA